MTLNDVIHDTFILCVHSGVGPADQPSFHKLEPRIWLIYFFFLQDGLTLSLCYSQGLRWWEGIEQEDRGRNDLIWPVSRAGPS